MKVFAGLQTRDEYIATQIDRSNAKFGFCNVSIHDVAKYQRVIVSHGVAGDRKFSPGPILCLGTRNGREVDLFRIQFFESALSRWLVRLFERRTVPLRSFIPGLESLGRSNPVGLAPDSVLGVEINPNAASPDVWIGSFDEMPCHWENSFGIAYSNSFDQSQDPHKTAKEWRRVIRTSGYLIFAFAEGSEPSIADPVGDLHLNDVLSLFGGELVYFHRRGSRAAYTEVVLRLNKAS